MPCRGIGARCSFLFRVALAIFILLSPALLAALWGRLGATFGIRWPVISLLTLRALPLARFSFSVSFRASFLATTGSLEKFCGAPLAIVMLRDEQYVLSVGMPGEAAASKDEQDSKGQRQEEGKSRRRELTRESHATRCGRPATVNAARNSPREGPWATGQGDRGLYVALPLHPSPAPQCR